MSDEAVRELAVRVATPPHVVQTSEAVRLAEAVLALLGEREKPVAAPWSKSDFEAVVKRQVSVIAGLREQVKAAVSLSNQAVEQRDAALVRLMEAQTASGFEALRAQAEASMAAMAKRIADLEAEEELSDALTTRLDALLKGVAVALKGEPEPLTQHSHHDLPEVAAAMQAELNQCRIDLGVALNRAEEVEQRLELLRD